MQKFNLRAFRLDKVIEILRMAENKVACVEEEWLVSQCAVSFSVDRRYVKDYIKDLVFTGSIVRVGKSLMSRMAYEESKASKEVEVAAGMDLSEIHDSPDATP